MNVLIVNCNKRKCGVYEFGLNLIKCLDSEQGNHTYDYFETDSPIEETFLDDYQVIVYNHHPLTLPWLNSGITDRRPSALIVHDYKYPWSKVGYIFADPTQVESGRDLRIGRPILPPLSEPPQVIPNSVGSFGFGFANKGFERLIQQVNDEYDEATVRLNIPRNDSVDADGSGAYFMASRCFSLAKPGVKCYITHEYMDEERLLTWLGEHEINAFFYQDNLSTGLASTIDWAIRARRPFAVSQLPMFRHVHSVVDGTDNLRSIIYDFNDDSSRFEQFYKEWTPANLHRDFERIVPKVIGFYS